MKIMCFHTLLTTLLSLFTIATPAPLPELFRPVAVIDEIPPGAMRRLHASADGSLWLVTEARVSRLVHLTWSVYVADFSGRPAGIDACGRVWVLPEDASAISAWDGTSWTSYGPDQGWTPYPIDSPYDLWNVDWGQTDAQGRLWLASPWDVRFFDADQWTVFTPQDMGFTNSDDPDLVPVYPLAFPADTDVVWVGQGLWLPGIGPAGGQGIRQFDGQTWSVVDVPAELRAVTDIEADGLGGLWIGSPDGIWHYDPIDERWDHFLPTGEPPFGAVRYGYVTDIVVDPAGDPWVAVVVCRGASCDADVIHHLRGGVWTPIMTNRVQKPHLVFDSAGTPWIFADQIYRATGDVAEPVADLRTQTVAVDANRQVWFIAQYEDQTMLWTIDAEPGD